MSYGNDPQPQGSNPYLSPNQNVLPPHLSSNQTKGGSPWRIVIIIGVVMLVLCGLCVLCAVGGWFGMLGILENEITRQYSDHPSVEEHIGDIQDINLNFWESVEEKEARGNREDVFVFDVEGDRGRGKIIVGQQNSAGSFDQAELHLQDGREFNLNE